MPKTNKDVAEYETGEWAGKVHYRCTKCAFDTFDGRAMLNHLVFVHDSFQALEALEKQDEEVSNGTNDTDENHG